MRTAFNDASGISTSLTHRWFWLLSCL